MGRRAKIARMNHGVRQLLNRQLLNRRLRDGGGRRALLSGGEDARSYGSD